MAYVAVKGGERAIDNAHAWLAEERRGNPATPALSVAQIDQQLGRSVDRVMAEGSLYDRELAALAIKQAQGDLIEAAYPAAGLPHHPASLGALEAGRDRRYADRAPGVRDLQGFAGRSGARPNL